MTRFKAVDRETPYLLPASVQDWLPEQHLARFVVEVVSKLDLHKLKMPYTGVGSEAFNPEMLLGMLLYGYATGVFSSRKLEALLSDTGYRSESNTRGCHAAGITPYFPAGRQSHHPPVEARFTEPPALAADADVVQAMDHRLAVPAGGRGRWPCG